MLTIQELTTAVIVQQVMLMLLLIVVPFLYFRLMRAEQKITENKPMVFNIDLRDLNKEEDSVSGTERTTKYER